jgi:hypothetical protein
VHGDRARHAALRLAEVDAAERIAVTSWPCEVRGFAVSERGEEAVHHPAIGWDALFREQPLALVPRVHGLMPPLGIGVGFLGNTPASSTTGFATTSSSMNAD